MDKNLPLGAEFDSNAPYNEKTVKYKVTVYYCKEEIIELDMYDNVSDSDIKDATTDKLDNMLGKGKYEIDEIEYEKQYKKKIA